MTIDEATVLVEELQPIEARPFCSRTQQIDIRVRLTGPGSAYLAARPGGRAPTDLDYADILGEGQSDEEEGLWEQDEATVLRHSKSSDPLVAARPGELDRLAAWGRGFESRPDSRLDKLMTMLDAICRPSGRWSNERVVLFTEYAHTLEWVRRVLIQQGYGDVLEVIQGSTPTEDRELIRERFSSDPTEEKVRVLLATDAADEGIDVALSAGLAAWRRPLAVHDPGTVVLDLAVSLALGGDCLADIGLLRSEPGVYGRVASDPTVSRTIDALAADAPAALKAIDAARAAVRARVWALAGEHAPDHGADAAAPLVIDIDATLVTAHSEKESAAPTFKRGFGFHPLWTFLDHGPAGSGEPLAVLLRAGNAGSNTAADHIAVARQSLAQLPSHRRGSRPGRRVLIRTDGAGATHEFLTWLHRRRLSYSIGFGLPADTAELLKKIPAEVWAPACDANDEVRDGAWVAELTGLLDLSGWPPGMRVIARKERPHPGAQLRITDADGLRVTAFATNTTRGQLPELELRHRRRARAEDRIRCAKDTGLTNLPLHDFTQNQIWCAIIALACDLTAWMQTLALPAHPARRWEPKRLRTRLFTVPATLARTGRRTLLHLADHHPWAHVVHDAVNRLRDLTATPTTAPG